MIWNGRRRFAEGQGHRKLFAWLPRRAGRLSDGRYVWIWLQRYTELGKTNGLVIVLTDWRETDRLVDEVRRERGGGW